MLPEAWSGSSETLFPVASISGFRHTGPAISGSYGPPVSSGFSNAASVEGSDLEIAFGLLRLRNNKNKTIAIAITPRGTATPIAALAPVESEGDDGANSDEEEDGEADDGKLEDVGIGDVEAEDVVDEVDGPVSGVKIGLTSPIALKKIALHSLVEFLA